MRFVDREIELRAINKRLDKQSSFSLIYGQRRTGKTYLLQYLATQRENALHFLADESTAAMSLERFWGEVLAERVARGVSAVLQPSDWGTALTLLVQQAITNDEPLVLFIDEVQFLIQAEPSLPSILSRLWDQYHERASIHIILCGSALGTLRGLGDAGQPLHGRFDLRLKLRPFAYHEAGLFVPEWSLHDRLRAYGLFGGLARHLAELDDGVSLRENALELLCEPLSSLADAPMDILRSEHLSSLAESAAVVEAMALGETRFNRIASRTQLKTSRLNYILGELIGLEIVGREVRFGDREGAKYSRYWIADPFIGFWFRHIRPNRVILNGANTEEVWAQRIEPRLDNWMGPIFERIVAQTLRREGAVDELPFIDTIASYWSRDERTQIDWIASSDETLLFVECKWKARRKVGVEALKQLREHASRYPKSATDRRYCIASPTGFSEELIAAAGSDVTLLGPAELA